jgi:hypothetical protein
MTDVVWVHYARPRPHWYSASREEQRRLQSLWAEVAEHSRARGAARIGRWSVRGQSDFSTVEIWTFGDAEAVLEHWNGLIEVGYPEWFSCANSLGTALLEGV